MANVEATLKVVAGKVGEQQTQYTNNGLNDICWKAEAKGTILDMTQCIETTDAILFLHVFCISCITCPGCRCLLSNTCSW